MENIVWLIGCKGMLGTQITRDLELQSIPFIGTDIEVDITKIDKLRAFAKKCENDNQVITWIINCSAYTAVDNAEDNKDFAQLLNVEGPKNIATLANEISAKMIHLSTDYVFDGTASTPYTENMQKKPIGVYGITKADGEDAVLEILPNDSYIVRTAWLYGWDGKNFVYTMINLMNAKDSISVVNDQVGSPTFAGDLSKTIIMIIQSQKEENPVDCGIYHFTNNGEITWFDFAKEIYSKAKAKGLITSECTVSACSSDQFPTKAKRPTYSVLSKDKIQKALNIQIPMWHESLEVFLTNSLYNNK